MAFESALRIYASPKCAGYTYNYFGSRAGEHINYNRNNRIPISPIGLTGGNEDRAIKMCARPDSFPPCRKSYPVIACMRLDKPNLGHDTP